MSTPTPEAVLSDLAVRVVALESAVAGLHEIEPKLRVLIDNIDFFRSLTTDLLPRIRAIENIALEATPARLKHLEAVSESLNKDTVMTQVTDTARTAVFNDLQELRKSLDDFKRDSVQVFATKED
ncbi:hypothetical protein EC991_000696, partial [Linnemannia zychae]